MFDIKEFFKRIFGKKETVQVEATPAPESAKVAPTSVVSPPPVEATPTVTKVEEVIPAAPKAEEVIPAAPAEPKAAKPRRTRKPRDAGNARPGRKPGPKKQKS